MMVASTRRAVVARWLFALGCGLAATAFAGTPYPHARTPAAQDAGALDLARGSAPITVTVALKLRDADRLQALATAIHTPGDPHFRKFLTSEEFQARFAPSPATIEAALDHFRRAGLVATVEYGNLLKVTGSTEAIQQAFNVKLHAFDVAAHAGHAGYRFHAPIDEPSVSSAAVADNVDAIVGLDNRPRFRPHLRKAPALGPRAAPSLRQKATPGNDPGFWTVTDLAQYYNIQPLYDQGFHGEGRTLAIVTLASFTPSDAFSYWTGLGLTTRANRLKVVDIDGGPGAPSDDSGSEETTLDVQQSGGVAPAAKMIVYQAPNTDQGFYDAFARAVNDNTAETVSVSWGAWEWFDTQTTVSAGRLGRSVQALQALNSLFLRAAVQGQSFFAAAGDGGAYDVEGNAPEPDYSRVLAVDAPAAAAWITAAGGTTLAGDQAFTVNGADFIVHVPTERVWGWDYLTGFCAALGFDPFSCGIFPAGTGGGVSAYVPRPFYQEWVAGMRNTEPHQKLVDYTTTPPTTIVKLPANYRGRNLPDVSLNADPETGYIIPYTSSEKGFMVDSFIGGTSFTAPQLNGIAALLGQRVRGRIGLFNVPLYLVAATPLGYFGPGAPLHDIRSGNNWFYTGHAGYDQGTGVGTLDVANFGRALLLLGY